MRTTLSALLLVGCSIVSLQSVDPSARTRIYPASQKTTWGAVLAYFSTEGYIIDKSDQASGLILTDYKFPTGLSAALAGNQRWKIQANISDLGDSSKIVLVISQESQSVSGWYGATMEEKDAVAFYGRVFEGIGAHLTPSKE